MSFMVYSYSEEPAVKNLNLEEAKRLQQINHAKTTDHYHEVHGPNHASQLEPDDCWKCGRNIYRCECQGLGYGLSDCLFLIGDCTKFPTIRNLCHNTECALNPWCSKYQTNVKGETQK